MRERSFHMRELPRNKYLRATRLQYRAGNRCVHGFETATGFVNPGVQTMFAAGMVNLKRDPFEMSWGDEKKAAFWFSGALAGPVTAYIYDWNLLPIGQMLWLKELETYKTYPPLQSPASYNLDQVMEQLRNARTHPSQ